MWMARTRLAHKRASTLVESGERPSRDLGGVPSGRLKGVPEVGLAGEPEAGQTSAQLGKRRKKQRTKEDLHLVDEIKAGKTEFLAGHEVRTAATGDSLVRDGDGGPAPTTSEQARGTANIICPDAGVDEGEGAASDSDDEEYTAPLDELLASDDSDDPMDDGGSEGEKGSNGKRAGDDEGDDDITASQVGTGRQKTCPLGDDPGEASFGGMTPDIESALRGEVFELVKEKVIYYPRVMRQSSHLLHCTPRDLRRP
ncbi:hypothetical protein MRB53_014211 [Persea americana]|uniref:Uncharacterized protein n=1 Tax=Persea americana TaxID=3435 RepID=A0ACC2KA48_PERAE|nr:hypothetical protein MRB53_014211 [Persea americana]